MTAVKINLVTSDLFKGAADLFKDLLDDALEIIKWFNNHTWALGMLKDTMATKIGKVLCLILPVITHWTSHYLSVQQLIKVEHAFRQLLLDMEDNLVKCAGDKEEAQEKAMQIIAKLQLPFFHKLRHLSQHLAPLATATNLFQSDHMHLDIVLITIARLFHIFSEPDLDLSACRAVLVSLEKRWAKQDQGIFILAVILNPYIRISAFERNSPFCQANEIQNLTAQVFWHFYRCEPDNEFMTSVIRYLH
ncbi:hypothetical protein DAEQUDRAFT_769439 [Daedalea quercina L-15889]|uniref:Uncharacterized protein n=1 Tax=Daedalea quercina L-15889 TaxID=1314783 RepID=A0A165LQB9_9APHY|nr:hypothetical protein DAEQUDRAFT_769439 [Daedalea quercina L-15889]